MRRWGFLLLLVLAGCATPQAEYVRDDTKYGVTEGPFRGRWWNYYERGRSFLDGGFYTEAREDFALALKERDRDQRWARTYGLHFTPQYFPNREFGVSLYYLEDYSRAITSLEQSYSQQPSARAAYYLRLARQAVSEGDTASPILDITVPGPVVASRTVSLAITASDDNYVSTISVGGRGLDIGVPAPAVQIAAAASIAPGQNTLLIQAVDIAGNRSEQRIEIAGDFDGPAISFDDPVTLPGPIKGTISDPAGLQSLTIAGKEAEMAMVSADTSRFRIDLSQADLQPPLQFVAADALGNISRGEVPTNLVRVADIRSGVVLAGAPRTVRLSSGLVALFAGEQLVAVARGPEADEAPAIRFPNLENGQRYLMDEIVVDLAVSAKHGIRSLTLNEVPVEFLPGRAHQRVSRRIVLDKEGPTDLVAVLVDEEGTQHEANVTVERVLTEVEALSNRLNLAMLGNIWEGPNRAFEAEETFVSDELTRDLYEGGRFDLVTREKLPQVLTEQELAAALGGRNGVSPLRDIVPTDLMVVGMVRRDAASIEIILQAINPETSQLAGYVDVAGPAESKDDLRALVADLALRLTQEFPRVQGHVVGVQSDARIFADLAHADRIRPRMKCLVFRYGAPIVHPGTGQELGRPTEILAEGWFNDVADALSEVRLNAGQKGGIPAIEVQDFVITK